MAGRPGIQEIRMMRPGNITLIGRKRKALEARFYGMHEKSWAMRQENNAACFCSVLCDIKKMALDAPGVGVASLNYDNDFMDFLKSDKNNEKWPKIKRYIC